MYGLDWLNTEAVNRTLDSFHRMYRGPGAKAEAVAISEVDTEDDASYQFLPDDVDESEDEEYEYFAPSEATY